jgi:hypothetical protein
MRLQEAKELLSCDREIPRGRLGEGQLLYLFHQEHGYIHGFFEGFLCYFPLLSFKMAFLAGILITESTRTCLSHDL